MGEFPDLKAAGGGQELPGDNIQLRSVGIDIGSTTSHLLFSAINLRRQRDRLSSRFKVTARETLYESPILLTPYRQQLEIDTEELSSFIEESYRQAGLTPEDIDTGAVIATGEAAKKENAAAITAMFSAWAGRFVCATAGPHLEARIAAYGSGAVRRSLERDGDPVLNLDVGGGSTKLALACDGIVVSTAAIAVPLLGACAPQPAAPGAKEPYKIGATFPQTGPLANWGVLLIPALELGVADVNRKGGVDGHPLQLVIEDTKSTPEGGVAAMRKVVQIDKVPMVLTIFTNVVTAQLPVAAELKVPLASTVQAPGLASKSEWLFVHATLLDSSLPPLIKVWEQKKVKKLFAFFPDNALGQFASETTKPAWTKSGGQYDEARFKLGETDFRGIVSRAKAFDPDTIFVYGQGTLDEVSIVKQIREMGMNTPIYGHGSLTISTFRDALGSLAEGIIFTSDKYDKQAAKDYIAAYQAKLGVEPDFAALQWYDIVQMTAEAIRKQGYTSEGIRKGLAAIKDFPLVGGGKASMDDTRQTKVEVGTYIVKGGQIEVYK